MTNRLTPLDLLLLGYTAIVALFIAFNFSASRRPLELLAAHIGIIAFVLWLPARGADWERGKPVETLSWTVLRHSLLFLRHMYPLGLVIFYFEEVRYFVNALWSASPYWFEPYLFAADDAVFGGTPGVLLNPWVGMPQDEIMHFFYFSYYLVVLGGGCFPSGHVAGTFGMSLGLLPNHPRAGKLCLFLAVGMAAACLYTRYHHGLDILAGLICAGLGYAFARFTVRRPAPANGG